MAEAADARVNPKLEIAHVLTMDIVELFQASNHRAEQDHGAIDSACPGDCAISPS